MVEIRHKDALEKYLLVDTATTTEAQPLDTSCHVVLNG